MGPFLRCAVLSTLVAGSLEYLASAPRLRSAWRGPATLRSGSPLAIRAPQRAHTSTASSSRNAEPPHAMQWHIAEAQRLELHATLEEAIALLRRALEEPSEPRALAEVHFHLGRMLALQRTATGGRIDEAQAHFEQAMTLQPEWSVFDSRLATPPGINRALSCFHEQPRSSRAARACESDVASVRAVLAEHGYRAWAVQGLLQYAGPPTPGPFYLRKRIDHRLAAALPAQPARRGLDVLVRLFLLGVAVETTLVTEVLGAVAVGAFRRLGLVASLPTHADPSPAKEYLISYVQLYPLSLAPALASAGDAARDCLGVDAQAGGGEVGCGGQDDDGKTATAVLRVVERLVVAADKGLVTAGGTEVCDGDECEAMCGNKTLAATELVVATDWPPPVSCTLHEEPVMYIGADSLGLVRMAAVALALSVAGGDAEAAGRGRKGGCGMRVLDVCCGSGVQGLAFARVMEVLGMPASEMCTVVCADINPRAVRFARFNAALNGFALDPLARADPHAADPTAAPARPRARHGDAGVWLDVRRSDVYAGVCNGVGAKSGGGDGDGVEDSWNIAQDRSSVGPATAAMHARMGCADDLEGFDGHAPEASAGGGTSFDVILANPPFVPVPPALNGVVRRYDVFADGGADGEALLRRILQGLPCRLRAGGWLCLVSELCNARQFPAKIERWLQAAETSGGGGAGQQGGQGVPRALVFHDAGALEYSPTAYSRQRAGTVAERADWLRHLHALNISSVARGYVFVEMTHVGAPGGLGLAKGTAALTGQATVSDTGVRTSKGVQEAEASFARQTKCNTTVMGWGVRGEHAHGDSDASESHGMSTWAPMNSAAAAAFARALGGLGFPQRR